MLAVALRRFRFESVAVLIGLAAVAALALVTGTMMHND